MLWRESLPIRHGFSESRVKVTNHYIYFLKQMMIEIVGSTLVASAMKSILYVGIHFRFFFLLFETISSTFLSHLLVLYKYYSMTYHFLSNRLVWLIFKWQSVLPLVRYLSIFFSPSWVCSVCLFLKKDICQIFFFLERKQNL